MTKIGKMIAKFYSDQKNPPQYQSVVASVLSEQGKSLAWRNDKGFWTDVKPHGLKEFHIDEDKNVVEVKHETHS